MKGISNQIDKKKHERNECSNRSKRTYKRNECLNR